MRACSAPTWLTLCTHTGEGNCAKTCELVSPKRYAFWEDGAGRMQRVSLLCPGLAASFGVRDEMIRRWWLGSGTDKDQEKSESLDGRPWAVRLQRTLPFQRIVGSSGYPDTSQSQSRDKRLLSVIGATTVRLYAKDWPLISNNFVFFAGHFHSRYVFYLRGL